MSEHKRRVRYSGRNPRRFEDRYKEHDPERYAAEVEHIMAKGNTPAGMHRPICVEEILAALRPRPGDVCLDATLGYGGHARALLERIAPGGRLFGVDVDPLELPRTEARLRAAGFGEDVFVARQTNFAGVRSLLYEAGGGFDCVLADLGVSSMQLDNPARGFTYKADGPLDLRLNPGQGRPASDLLASLTVRELEAILRDFSDEPLAAAVARAAKSAPVATTTELARAVERVSRDKGTLARTFQALRIAVNQELSVLDKFLEVLPDCLKPGGRVAILTFHSGEDRRVKKAFQNGPWSDFARSPVLPGAEEKRANPRSSCAKLRWAVKAGS